MLAIAMFVKRLLGLPVIVALVACGGGAGSEDGAPPPLPVGRNADPTAGGGPPPNTGVAPENDPERAEVEALLDETTGKPGPDRDGDGIDDVDEELLLRHFRPYLKFSKDGSGNDESHRPADPIAVLEDAQLVQQKPNYGGVTAPLSGCGAAPNYHLDPVSTLYTCKKDTSFLSDFAKTTYAINIDNADYGGVPFADYQKNAEGFFGHVVNDTVNGHPAYKIEYWQYYAYNNQDLGVPGFREFGDHEGDWTGIQLWYDETENRIAQVLHLIHGRKASFHYTATMLNASCASCFVTIKGPKYDPNPGNFFDATQALEYTDNQSEVWFDEKKSPHVVVYVENGGHESWPFAFGHADIDLKITTWHPNPHKGDGTNMIAPVPTTRPLNAGEVKMPMTSDFATILQYNGYWGNTNTNDFGVHPRKSPPGPASHCEWKFPDRGPISACEN